jgi:hypothetical protein
MAKRITFRDLPQALKEATRHIREQVEAAALDTVSYGAQHAVALTNDKGLVDTGYYKEHWQFAPIPGGGELRNDAPYAAPIEYGRRPGRPGPPLAPILEWVERKLVGNGDVDPGDALDVALRIRSKIHKHGTPPKHVMLETFQEMREYFIAEVRRRDGG